MIDRHPDATCHGEVFNQWAYPANKKNSIDDTYDWFTRGENVATGFITHGIAPNVHLPDYERIEQLMYNDDALRVIVLHRNNLLERFVSHKTARASQQWVLRQGDVPHKPIKFAIDAGELWQDMLIHEATYKLDLRWRFGVTQVFKYEHLVTCRASLMRDVYRFLGLDEDFIHQGDTLKQGCPLRETVINYDELKKAFSQTQFADFFIE